ncbi:MAG: class I SAM-dependent methyltransferase [Solirubrobacterales bacterium]
MPSSPAGWSDPERVAEYLSREIPHRQVAESMLLSALPRRLDRVLDLGTGDGRLVSLLRAEHPKAEAIGIDSSDPMLARAQERFDGDAGVEFRLHDLGEPLPQIGPFDAVVSGLAIHHLEDDRKRALFAEIRSLLAPAGVFANLDLVRASTPELRERFRREIGRPDDDPADRLDGLCDQLAWLRAAGFADADCHFKWLQLTLVVGTA